jgi:hypothetical protein
VSQVSLRFKDNIAATRTLSELGKNTYLSKTILAADESEKHNAPCDVRTLPKICVSLIRPHSSNLVRITANLF